MPADKIKGQILSISIFIILIDKECFCCSFTQLCLSLYDPMDRSTPGFPVHHLPELPQTHVRQVHDAMKPSHHLILHHPLLFLPSIFPSIRVLSSESVLCIRWPKYWSFSFSISISPSNEYSGLTGWISLLSKGLSRVFSKVNGSS